MRGTIHQLVKHARLLLLVVALLLCAAPTAQAIRCPTPGPALASPVFADRRQRLNEESPSPDQRGYVTWAVDSEGRIGLFVGNNPINLVDPYGLWSLYRYLYTGDGNASDEVYNEGVDAAAEYLFTRGAARGASAGFSASFGKGNLRPNISAGGNWTMDKGWGCQFSAGGNYRDDDYNQNKTTASFGLGYAWNQTDGGRFRGGFGARSSDTRVSTGVSEGSIGKLNLGIQIGKYANIGIIVDPNRIVGNFKDSLSVLSGHGVPGYEEE